MRAEVTASWDGRGDVSREGRRVASTAGASAGAGADACAGAGTGACRGRGGAAVMAVPWLGSGREREEERKEGRTHM